MNTYKHTEANPIFRFSPEWERTMNNLLNGLMGNGNPYPRAQPAWWNEPVSPAQLAKLTQLGFNGQRPKLKGEASRAINELLKFKK